LSAIGQTGQLDSFTCPHFNPRSILAHRPVAQPDHRAFRAQTEMAAGRNFIAALRLNAGLREPSMDSRTKHEFWIMTVSTLFTVAVATIAFAVLTQVAH
jgi:hypothetical protein